MPDISRYPDKSIAQLLAEKDLDSNIDLWQERIRETCPQDVESALNSEPGSYSLQKLMALVSPVAENYLERMAQLANQLTLRRFGRAVRLYAPLYLSNYCINNCKYCGFNKMNESERTRLTISEALTEANVIASSGFREILLVSGEDRKFITTDYLVELASRLRETFSFISVEIYQMSPDQYADLFVSGIEGVTIYQETYDRRTYAHNHLQGPKSDFDRRLRAPDDIAAAGMREIGLGVLLGLQDWRTETLALAEHAHYLIKRYWQSHISFSFPRLRPAQDVQTIQFEHLLSDKDLVQMILALRLCFADAGLVLSTRERAELRDYLLPLGITKLSAGSRTNPKGYTNPGSTTEQFEVSDQRSPAQVATILKEKGFDPVWKDWDPAFVKMNCPLKH